MAEKSGGGGYPFSQPPMGIALARKKLPAQQTPAAAAAAPAVKNLMWDKRIVRGPAFTLQPLPMAQTSPPDLAAAARDSPALPKRPAPVRPVARPRLAFSAAPLSPLPADTRRDMVIQTEAVIEVLQARPEDHEWGTQTDALLDRPPTPPYVPAAAGRNMETQIDDGDLFDFDEEVEPILEVVVGQAVEQALREVTEEAELQALRQRHREAEARRRSESAAVERLEAAERRRAEEARRRMAQEEERLRKERAAAHRLAAHDAAAECLAAVEGRVFTRLEAERWFHDAVEREVETVFLPRLMAEMQAEVERLRDARALADELIRGAVLRLGVNIEVR